MELLPLGALAVVHHDEFCILSPEMNQDKKDAASGGSSSL
jgi:hypothetical protein